MVSPIQGLWTGSALIAALVLGCASGPAGVAPPQGAPVDAVEAPSPMEVATAGGLEAAGRSLADQLARRVPGYWGGRVAVGWDTRQGWLEPLGEGFARRWHSAVLLSDMGAVAHDENQAYIQLDPSSFAGLLWVNPEITAEGRLMALDLSLLSTQGRPVQRLRMTCSPPLALRPTSVLADGGAARLWIRLPEPPRALFCSAGGELWVALPGQVERLDQDGKAVQSWDLGPAPTAPGRAVLGSGEAGDANGDVGFFDLGRGSGWWFRRQPSGSYAREAASPAYPLAPRLQRFFSAPFDASAGEFQVQDFQGKLLASAADLARFQGPAGTMFGLLGPDGSLSVLDGNRLSVLPGPSLRPVAALAGHGSLLLDATADPPFVVRAHALSPSGAWQTQWTSAPLPSPVTSLTAGALGGKPQIFAGVGEAEGAVYALECPLLAR